MPIGGVAFVHINKFDTRFKASPRKQIRTTACTTRPVSESKAHTGKARGGHADTVKERDCDPERVIAIYTAAK